MTCKELEALIYLRLEPERNCFICENNRETQTIDDLKELLIPHDAPIVYSLLGTICVGMWHSMRDSGGGLALSELDFTRIRWSV